MNDIIEAGDEPQPIAVQGSRAVASAVTPADLLRYALDSGADLDRLEKLMDLQQRHEANEARKAYVSDMAEFKKNPPEVIKDKQVAFSGTSYMHATLGNVTEAIVAALARHGFSHRWDIEQAGANVTVHCILTHKLGHSERTTLTAAKDDSGKKNNIQQMASAVTYLQRYTLLAATGVATKDQDDDGEASELREMAGQMDKPGSKEAKHLINATALKRAIDAIKADQYTYKELVGYYALTPEQDTEARMQLGMEAAT